MGATRFAILLVPGWAIAGSQLASFAHDNALHASARVEFKIVIPSVLYLSVADPAHGDAAGTAATIVSNAHSVAFSAGTINSIVIAGRRQVISEHPPCASLHDPGNATPVTLTCTLAAP